MVIKILAEVERICSQPRRQRRSILQRRSQIQLDSTDNLAIHFSAVEPISVEQLAKVYSSVMHEAGLAVGGASFADFA
ncbi:hypothetical protein ULG90_17270 [Halopseudomonas pachastrellae]|nr:hypothetical protein ULG90_17270 [Halopseudomonas pachastrellae]